MRITFTRPAQFPLRDGSLTETYEPDTDHNIPDDIMAQIEESLLYKRLRKSGAAIPIKDTAPTPAEVEKQRKDAERKRKVEEEQVKRNAEAAEKAKKEAEEAERKRKVEEETAKTAKKAK